MLFDFNKSTLQPASDPVLQQILDLLKKSPALKIEVQGDPRPVPLSSLSDDLKLSNQPDVDLGTMLADLHLWAFEGRITLPSRRAHWGMTY